MTIPSESLRYRPARREDVSALSTLWEESTDWGMFTSGEWRTWYESAPYGAPLVVVAENEEGTLVGELVFIPCTMWIDGNALPGVRASTAVLHPELRPRSAMWGKHPAVDLYNAGVALAREKGFATVHSLPNQRWMKFLDRAALLVPTCPRQRASCPCVAVDFPAAPRHVALGRVAEVTVFGGEYERLWEKGRNALPVRTMVGRDPAWLLYKKNAGYLTLEVRSAGGSLVGYSAIDIRRRNLGDFFAADPDDLVEVLNATVAWLGAARENGRLADFDRVSALVAPATSAVLAAAGFVPIDFEFGFFADALDDRVPIEALALSEWFLAIGD